MITAVLFHTYPHLGDKRVQESIFQIKVTPIFCKKLPPYLGYFLQLYPRAPVLVYLSFILSGYTSIFLLFWGRMIIEHLLVPLLNTPIRRLRMVNAQFPLPTFNSAYLDLTDETNELVNYFHVIKLSNIQPVIEQCYSGSGPQGYGIGLFLSRILKVKQTFVSDRILAKRLSENSTYRYLCRFEKGFTPAHNSYHTLRKRLGVDGYTQIHRNFIHEADALSLLNPPIRKLPKNRRNGIILIGDSTPIRSYCSSKGAKQEDGSWLFTDPSVSFGRPHHRDKYPVGHKAHSLITITGIPLISIVSTRSDSDQEYIFPLLSEFKRRFPSLDIAYIILDAGYDAEEIHKGIYEIYNIIPIIIRKKMVYQKGFTRAGIPLCHYGYPLAKTGIDYARQRTRFHCTKLCHNDTQMLFPCRYSDHGEFTQYTHFWDSYRKFGPALPTTIIYKKLKPFRTAIEREFGLVKENRYRMEYMNTYMGIDNVTLHVIEHDIVLTQDIIFEFKTTGKISPVIKL